MENRDSENANLARLLTDDEFHELCAAAQTFNAFDVLKIDQHEIRHSNVLAWLLRPNASHGMGSICLKRILSAILLYNNQYEKCGLSAASVELMDLDDADIRREFDHTDILITARDRSNIEIAVLIENKINAEEHDEQKKRYKERHPNRIHVYLTLRDDKNGPDKDGYLKWSYEELLKVLGSVVRQRRAQMTVPVLAFIEDYISVVRRFSMQDDRIVELCRQIYKRHRDAIDLITQHGASSVFEEVVKEILNEKKNFTIMYSVPSEIDFLPSNLLSRLPENSAHWKWVLQPRQVSVTAWLKDNHDSVSFTLGICQTIDPTDRERFITEATQEGIKFKSKSALKDDAKVSRFAYHNLPIHDRNDTDEVRKVVEELLSKASNDIQTLRKICQKVFNF